ncbi:MAG: hypothetical protein ABIJ36_03445 [Patescibacteria group bacterium]|nr:hypothetical protein [Patescibacteria group bacterium]
MLIKNLKNGKYKIESMGENGKVDVVMGEGIVEIEGAPFVINTAGEYEIKGIHIYGVNGGEGKTVFLAVTQERIKIAYISPLKEPLSPEQVEELADTDILLTFLTDENVKALEGIDPNLFIPINYSPELLQKYFSGMAVRTVDKLNIKSKDELTEEMEIVTL